MSLVTTIRWKPRDKNWTGTTLYNHYTCMDGQGRVFSAIRWSRPPFWKNENGMELDGITHFALPEDITITRDEG